MSIYQRQNIQLQLFQEYIGSLKDPGRIATPSVKKGERAAEALLLNETLSRAYGYIIGMSFPRHFFLITYLPLTYYQIYVDFRVIQFLAHLWLSAAFWQLHISSHQFSCQFCPSSLIHATLPHLRTPGTAASAILQVPVSHLPTFTQSKSQTWHLSPNLADRSRCCLLLVKGTYKEKAKKHYGANTF